MKYIMFIQPDGQELPIIFPSGFEHAKVGRMMHSTYPGIKARSAGFINIISSKESLGEKQPVFAICYGKSESMKLKHDEMDSVVISTLINKKD